MAEPVALVTLARFRFVARFVALAQETVREAEAGRAAGTHYDGLTHKKIWSTTVLALHRHTRLAKGAADLKTPRMAPKAGNRGPQRAAGGAFRCSPCEAQ